MKQDSEKTSFSLTREARELLRKLAEKNGISMTGILELLIRKEARTTHLDPSQETE